MNIIFNSIDDYISFQPEQFRERLELIRQIIKKAVPDAQEVISYQMPAFKYHGMLAFFAVFKDHYSLFVSPGVRLAFAEKLKPYRLTKSAVKFPLDEPVPAELVKEIISYAADRNLQKAQLKKSQKKKPKQGFQLKR